MKKPLIFLMMAAICGCHNEERKISVPAGIMPMDSAALVLRDIHKVESALMVSGIRQDSAQTLYRLRLEPELLKKYRLDTAKLNRTLRYYSSEPALLDSLYHLILKKTDSAAYIGH
jgi:hypothetical protein